MPPSSGRPPTLRELHDRRCYMLGITDKDKVERLWQERKAAEAAAKKAKKAKP